MTITKVIKDLIETNTYNEIVSNIGNTQPVTINSIVFANTLFTNTSNTSMLTTGGYFKLYGNNYQSGANVYLDKYLASNTRYVSSNELRVTFSTIPAKTYSLFLYNPDGSNAIKYKSFLVQGDNTIGYIAGGTATGGPGTGTVTRYSSVERITFSNDATTPDTRGNLPTDRGISFSFNTNEKGYISLGKVGSSALGTSIGNLVKILFNNDTASATTFPYPFPTGTLTLGSSVQNSTYGYHVSGFGIPSPGSIVSSILRMDFQNEAATPISKGSIDSARGYSTGAYNNTYGWIIGGTTSTIFTSSTSSSNEGVSLISRIDFSADTNISIVRGPTSTNYFAGVSVQNQNYTWFTGGLSSHTYNPGTPATFVSTNTTNIKRFDFSNDTVAATTRLPIISTADKTVGGSNENNDYGWFLGGADVPSSVTTAPVGPTYLPEFLDYAPSIGAISLVYRLTFASDTSAVSSRSSLNLARKGVTSFNGINT
jgi:hypothetical protein